MYTHSMQGDLWVANVYQVFGMSNVLNSSAIIKKKKLNS